MFYLTTKNTKDMKIEIIKKTDMDGWHCYFLNVDGSFVPGSTCKTIEEAERKADNIANGYPKEEVVKTIEV